MPSSAAPSQGGLSLPVSITSASGHIFLTPPPPTVPPIELFVCGSPHKSNIPLSHAELESMRFHAELKSKIRREKTQAGESWPEVQLIFVPRSALLNNVPTALLCCCSAVVVFPIDALICTSHYLCCSSAGTGNDGAPVANPGGPCWPQHSAPSCMTKALLHTAYVWLMKTNCLCWEDARAPTKENTSEAALLSSDSCRKSEPALKRKGWMEAGTDWQYNVMSCQFM